MADHHPRYQASLGHLWRRSAYERGMITAPAASRADAARGLVRMRALLERLGSPDREQHILHLTGSKGKGSTAAMCAAIARAHGKKTGLYTSPHLHTYRERITIDGEPITEAQFVRLTDAVEAAARDLEETKSDLGAVTTFEFLTTMGLLAFAEAGCAVTVLEVGMGGEFDATNVVFPHACAMTRIDLEHTTILGATLAEIAQTKSGIIKPGVPIAIGPNPAEAMTQVVARCRAVGAPMLVADRDWQVEGTWQEATIIGPWGEVGPVRLGLAGSFQLENAGTAVAASWLFDQALTSAELECGLSGASWPGRFERVERDGVTYVLDGAHTPAAAEALAAAVREEFPGEAVTLVVGCSSDKDLQAVLAPLAAVADAVIATQAVHPRSAPAAAVGAVAEALVPRVTVVERVADAVDLASHGTLVLVTGSLFTVAEGREALGLAEPDIPWGPWLASGESAPVR